MISTVTIQGLTAGRLASVLQVRRSENRTWVLVGDTPIVSAMGSALRKGGVPTVEVPEVHGTTGVLDTDEPRFSDVTAVLFADITMLSNVWTAHRMGFRIPSESYYRWATFEPEEPSDDPEARFCTPVWKNTVTAAVVSAGLQAEHQSINLVEVGSSLEKGRFGGGLLPLFWLKKGSAKIIPDPTKPGEPEGDMAIVLRRRALGLKNLLSHVEICDGHDNGFSEVMDRLAESARRAYPELPVEEVVAGIHSRLETFPAAIGGSIAIPHAYWDGVDRSTCFLAVVPDGVTDLGTPDGTPARLVFMLISPTGMATEHLESLAALATLGQEPELVELICRQRVPARVASLIAERG